MCRNIKTLHNFKPPATHEEVHASALQRAGRGTAGGAAAARARRLPRVAAAAGRPAARRRRAGGHATAHGGRL